MKNHKILVMEKIMNLKLAIFCKIRSFLAIYEDLRRRAASEKVKLWLKALWKVPNFFHCSYFMSFLWKKSTISLQLTIFGIISSFLAIYEALRRRAASEKVKSWLKALWKVHNFFSITNILRFFMKISWKRLFLEHFFTNYENNALSIHWLFVVR